MRTRPLWVFVGIAALMVGWLSTRMWFGELSSVWMLSCLLGAWAPFGAAVIFLYIREAGRQEHGVLAAWLVRAIGMHCVLVWLLGVNDYLRGPPNLPPEWNTDLGMPVVLLAFAPVFAVSVSIVAWIRRVSRWLDPPPMPTLHSSPLGLGAIPYRAQSMMARAVAPEHRSLLPFAMGAALCGMAQGPQFPSAWMVVASVVGLALVSTPRRRSVVPCIAAIIAVVGIRVVQLPMLTLAQRAAVAVVWPVYAMTAIVGYLALVEAGLRVRSGTARA